MINDIRYAASQLLELTNNIPIQITNFNTKQPDSSFEELMQQGNSVEKETNSNNVSFGTLGIPAGFNIDFSLLEKMNEDKTA